MSTPEQPPIAGQSAADYKDALRRLLEKCEEHTEGDGTPGSFDVYSVYVPLRSHLATEVFRRRERRTAAEHYRSVLSSLVGLCDEYAEVCDRSFGHLGIDPFESFQTEVAYARRRFDDDVSDLAPDDSTNPVIVLPVPVPERDAEPVNDAGVRQGDWVKARWGDEPRQILTGPDERDMVRVSDARDGCANWGGYFIGAASVGGRDYPVVEPPPALADTETTKGDDDA